MALYEYQCENCGEVFELIQKFVDEPLTVHEKCGGNVHRLISRSAFQFKGSGWYVNDYAKAKGTPANGDSKDSKDSKKGESSESSGTKEGSTAKSDSGTAAKSSDSSSSSTPSSTTPSTSSSTTSNSSSDKK
jgi:putative FmdB family regulatory protein